MLNGKTWHEQVTESIEHLRTIAKDLTNRVTALEATNARLLEHQRKLLESPSSSADESLW